MRKKLPYYLVGIACLAVFLFSGHKLANYYLSAYQEESLYQDLNQQVQDAQQAAKDEANNQTGNEDGSDSGDEDSTVELPLYAESGRLYRYDALYLQNNDLVGWIYVPGTDNGYPVMQTPDDEEYYLRKNFYRKKSSGGTPFLDKDSDLEDPASRVMVYGHNLKSGGMFTPFTKYTKASHWKKHPTFTFDTLYESRTYRILAVVQVDINGSDHFAYYAYDRFSSAASFNGFVQEAKDASLYDTGVTAEYGQQIMIISTCSYHVDGDGGRLAIIAVQEPAESTPAQ